jgi:F-type H+-transporting ATPase subunit gamma
MASAKDLKKRMISVKNTQQITRAMKLVSAAKLRRSQDNILALRPYAHEISKIIQTISYADENVLNNELLHSREEIRSVLVVVVTSDRGLCGGFNSNVIKTVNRYLKTSSGKYKKIDLAFIGKKGFEFFKDKKSGKYYNGFYIKFDFKKASDLANELIDLYLKHEYDEIKFIYNEFKSALVQKVNIEHFLPVKHSLKEESSLSTQPLNALFEPSLKEVLNEVMSRHFATQVYRIMLESIASENAARMTAMENATKNAGEMLRRLSLEYNKTRQASITKELLEIVSGAESLKG